MISAYLDMRQRSGPVSFLVSFLLITFVTLLAVEWIYAWLHQNHHLTGLIVFLNILIAIFGYSVLLTQVVRRLKDMNWHGMYAMLTVLPVLAVAVIAGFGSFSTLGRVVIVLLGIAVLTPLVAIPSQRPDAAPSPAH